MNLTPRDEEVLEYIRNFMLEKGVAPTMQDIGEGLNIKSTKTVFKHFQKLVSLGYIEQVTRYGYKVKGVRYTWDKQE